MSDVLKIADRIRRIADSTHDYSWLIVESEVAVLAELLDEYVEAKIKEALIKHGFLVEREYGE